jgi:glutamate N-acetyltransferase/amino-acid N-acetyltransferase
MKKLFTPIEGSITTPKGFRAAAMHVGIKEARLEKLPKDYQPKKDLGLIVSALPAHAAGVFTVNQVKAAPVRVSLDHVGHGRISAVILNSGNANACTGEQGLKDANEMCARVGETIAVKPREVAVCSTGRIGIPLPMDKVLPAIPQLILAINDTAGTEVAEAIMTTDTFKKECAVELTIDKKRVIIAGIAKGAGMIAPFMTTSGSRPSAAGATSASALHATMLCAITTDAAVPTRTLQDVLQRSVNQSFNRVTVDGDMSTNDTVLILANGLAGNNPLNAEHKELPKFQEAVNHVTRELAKMIVRDGEGVSKFVTVEVVGALSNHDAEVAAKAVANSVLVKTSWCGNDPNWGRIMDAIGYSTALVDPAKVSINYGGFAVVENGVSTCPANLTKAKGWHKRAKLAVAKSELTVTIDLRQGEGQCTVWTTDLTEKYVELNKGE